MKPIVFNGGFNVIFGDVEDDSQSNNEHNLGKTSLVELIDFLLLKGSGADNVLFKHKESFSGWYFFLELDLGEERYLTIKRGVGAPSRVSFKIHNEEKQDFSNEESWDYKDTQLSARKSENSIDILENLLNFNVLENYNPRFFLAYLLRTQYQYSNVFKMANFEGAHLDWKAPLFSLLGFDDKYVIDKYRIQYEIDNTKKLLKMVLAGKKGGEAETYALKAAITEKEKERTGLNKQLDEFDFYLREQKLNKELIEDIETRIGKLNSERYRIDFDIKRTEEALKEKVVFRIEDIEQVFKETKIYFPDAMKKDYQDTLDFNLSISQERAKYLKDNLKSYLEYLEGITSELKELNKRKEEHLSFLRGTETFAKYRHYQQDISRIDEQITQYKLRLASLGTVDNYEEKIGQLEDDAKEVASKLKKVIDERNDIYDDISSFFSELFKKTMHTDALLFVHPNKKGNPEFESVTVSEEIEEELTGKSRGYSSRKVQCSAFVLAVLFAYRNNRFFKFAYHDGLFESWGNNPKRKFIAEARDICDSYKIQYIVSMIKSDVPEGFEFKRGEIVRTLSHEDRLFGFEF